jgi:ankyrin repeat protein
MRMRYISRRRLSATFFEYFCLSIAVCLLALPALEARAADAPLIVAARNGDGKAVSELLQRGADARAVGADGSTALLWAAYNADTGMVDALVAAGADVDGANQYGITPLLQASLTGDAAVIGRLIAGGAATELAHPDGMTPLMAAAQAGRIEAVEILLEHGADPNASDRFQAQTALMWAAAEGHADVVDALLVAGADPNAQAHVNSLSERKNADFPSGGFTALMYAVRNGYEDIVRRLANSGADLNLRNGDGASAMMIAIVNDRFDLAASLIELGADVNDGSLYHAVEMRDATTDWYARDGSRLRANHDNAHSALDLIAMLLDAGADPNRQFTGQMHSTSMCCDSFANGSPFYRAAVAADVEALKLLIEHGADLEWTPERVDGAPSPQANANVGKTALMVAMNGGRGVPLSAGPGYSREGPPPFRESSNREPADAMRVLISAGADPDKLTPGGDTLLHEAVRARKTDIMRALAESGARLDLPNKDGLTPLFLAENPLPDPPTATFGPRRDIGEASPEEVAALMRELIQTHGARSADAQASNAQ